MKRQTIRTDEFGDVPHPIHHSWCSRAEAAAKIGVDPSQLSRLAVSDAANIVSHEIGSKIRLFYRPSVTAYSRARKRRQKR